MIIVRTRFRRPVPAIQHGSGSRSRPRRSSLTTPRHRPGAGADQPSGCASSRPHRAGSPAADRSPHAAERLGKDARVDVVRRDFALRCRPVTSSPTGRALYGFVPPASEGNAFAIRVPLRPPGAPMAQNLIRDISMANEFDQTFRASPLTQARAPSALAGGYGARAVEPLATPIRSRSINASRPGPPQVRPQVSAPSCRP